MQGKTLMCSKNAKLARKGIFMKTEVPGVPASHIIGRVPPGARGMLDLTTRLHVRRP